MDVEARAHAALPSSLLEALLLLSSLLQHHLLCKNLEDLLLPAFPQKPQAVLP